MLHELASPTCVVEVEVVCSDAVEHRRRVESRTTDIDGLPLPTWVDVEHRDYEAWDSPHVRIDTAHHSPTESLAELCSALGLRR